MNTKIADNKYYLLTIICVLQNTVTSMIRLLSRDNPLITRVKKNEDVRLPSSVREAKKDAHVFINDIKDESNTPVAGYKNMPQPTSSSH